MTVRDYAGSVGHRGFVPMESPAGSIVMMTCLFLSASLCLGQTSTSATDGRTEFIPFGAAATFKNGMNPVLPPQTFATASPMDDPERWLLMNSLQGSCFGWTLDSARLQVYGWTDSSYTASSAAHSNLPLGFNYRANQFLLQQNWLTIERPVVTTGTTEPTFGFHSDWILPGTDYRFTVARGLFSSQLTTNNGQPSLYGIDPFQFYGEAYFPTVAHGLDVKVGRFKALYGAEVTPAVNNLLFSHSYTFIYNPFTHTGGVATLKLNDTWTVQAGLVTGSDIFIAPGANPTFVGSVQWAPPDGADSVLLSVIVGKGRFDQKHNLHNPQVFDLVYTHKFNSRLSYTFNGLFGYTGNVPDTGTAYWFGAVNYLTYDFAARLKGIARLEFFDDIDGNRTGFKGLYTSLTAGLNFQLRRHIVIRPEIRYDYNNVSRPFENQHGLFTAATDFIVRW